MGLFFLPPSHLLGELFLAQAQRAASAARGAGPLYSIRKYKNVTYELYVFLLSVDTSGLFDRGFSRSSCL